MNTYSYAGPARGGSDPEDIRIIEVNGAEECPNDRCARSDAHIVIMWSGNEYSKRNTWISALDEHTINLENAQ